MAITPIQNGDSGQSVRDKINALLAAAIVSYVGQIGTRTRIPSFFISGTPTLMARKAEIIKDNTNSFRLVYGNFYTTGVTENSPGAATTITASVEYPAGTFTQVTFSGSATGAMADGQAQLVSDPVALTLKRNAQIWFNTWQSNPSGVLACNLGYRSAAGDQISYGASIPDTTMSTWSGANTGFTYGPTAMISTTSVPSVALVGDSRVAGVGDSGGQSASSVFVGTLAPNIAPRFPVLDLSRASDRAQYAAGTGWAKRLTYLQYVSHAIMTLGINDAIALRSASQINADRQTVYAAYPNVKWFEATMEPNTTSTVAISALTSSGTTATAVIPAVNAAVLAVGQTIAIAGATPAGYNGSVVITAVSGQNISYTLLAGASGLAAASPTGTLSDIWASAVFQTVAAGETARVSINDSVRQGTPNVSGYFDIADAAENNRNGGKFRSPPQVPGILTADGLHMNQFGWITGAPLINTSQIAR